jgi:two-component system, OmpR family, response regulator
VVQSPHILVVDDDLEIRKLLGRYLTAQQFRVTLASDKSGLKDALASDDIALIVLDVLLLDGSGLDVCRELRAEGSLIPIILLTALKEEVDRIIGLELGADDYLGKPFNPRELLARIRAILRRPLGIELPASTNIEYRFEGFLLQAGQRRVVRADGSALDLTSAEYQLLYSMVSRPGRVLSREYLLDLTSRGNSDSFGRAIDVLMSRIRSKLGDGGSNQIIKTVRNGGYVLTARIEKVGVGA